MYVHNNQTMQTSNIANRVVVSNMDRRYCLCVCTCAYLSTYVHLLLSFINVKTCTRKLCSFA